MIDCPICHVMNDDQVRFCAECGHRLAPATSSLPPLPTNLSGPAGAAPTTPPIPSPNQNPANSINNNTNNPKTTRKLHSPLLGGDTDEDDEIVQPKSAFPHRSSTFQNISNSEAPERKSMRSPLLGNSGSPGEETQTPRVSKKLHSPLLGDDFEENYTVAESDSRPSHPSGLHSPLLDGDSSYGGIQDRTIPASMHRSSLHSPILGSGQAAPNYEEEEEDDQNPNVLRSPLLMARSKISDKPTAKPSEPPVTPAIPSHQQTPMAANQPMPGFEQTSPINTTGYASQFGSAPVTPQAQPQPAMPTHTPSPEASAQFLEGFSVTSPPMKAGNFQESPKPIEPAPKPKLTSRMLAMESDQEGSGLIRQSAPKRSAASGPAKLMILPLILALGARLYIAYTFLNSGMLGNPAVLTDQIAQLVITLAILFICIGLSSSDN